MCRGWRLGETAKKIMVYAFLAEGRKPNGTEHERRRKGECKFKRSRLIVTLAHNVNCAGNANRLRHVKWEA